MNTCRGHDDCIEGFYCRDLTYRFSNVESSLPGVCEPNTADTCCDIMDAKNGIGDPSACPGRCTGKDRLSIAYQGYSLLNFPNFF